MMTIRHKAKRATATMAILLGLAGPAMAASNLIINGDFEQTTGIGTGASISTGSATNAANVAASNLTGWVQGTRTGDASTPGFNFVVQAGQADTNGMTFNNGGQVYLYGPSGGNTSASNYSNNGLTASSPTGGNFIVADGDPSVSSAISQNVTGLTVGQDYTLSFYWASGQLYDPGNSGASTTERWQVGFGSATATTATNTTIYKGFDAWVQTTITFTASATSQVLSFLAVGTPAGNPPTALLDGVALVATPEPATWAILMVGMAGVAFMAHKRRRNASPGTAAA